MKKIIIIALMFSGIFSLANADCYLVYSSKVTSSLGGPGRHGPMSDSKCSNLKAQQAGVVGSSNVWCDCSSGGSSTSGYSGKDAWKYQMMQGIVGGLMQGFMQGLENQQRAEAERAEQQRQQQEAARLEAELQRQKTEAEKKAAKEAWENKRKEAVLAEKRRKEQDARDAANLAAKMGSGSGGLVLVPMGGTNFFGSGTGSGTLELKSIAKGEYDAAKMPAVRKAMCSSSFLTKARASRSDEEARYYSDQAERVMSGGKYNEACDFSGGLPDIPEAPAPEPLWSPEEMAFFKKVEEVSVQMQEKALQIQEIEAKVTENKEKIDDAKAKKEQADAILKDLQSKAASTDDPAKKADIDTLLAEANALLSEAENDSLTAQQENEKLLSDKQKIEQSMQETKKMLEAQIPKPNTAQGAENEKR